MKQSAYLVVTLLLLSVLHACGSGSSDSSSAPSDTELLSDRSYALNVPASYDVNTPIPLVILLHGFGGNGDQILGYWRFAAAAERHGFVVVYPNGERDSSSGRPFWNATDACCGFERGNVDDVRYLSLLIDDVETKYNIDPKRIYVSGHSNGGFMSHRMACDRSNRIAAIVALAGVSWKDPDQCQAREPVSVLQVHGDLDTAISYNGGFNGGVAYPSAEDTVTDWADSNGCTGMLVDTGMSKNVDSFLSGKETQVQSYTDCPTGGAVELWTITRGVHSPTFDDNWPDLVWEFMKSHPKP